MKKQINTGLCRAINTSVCIAVLLLASCKKDVQTAPERQPLSATAPDVSNLTNGLGNGVNLQPSYYNNGNVNFGWSLMKSESKIKTVRIEIEPSVSISTAASWIQQAHSNGYAIIATYHNASELGSDNTSYLNAAASWWQSNYSTLSKGGGFTINLMNEWGSHTITDNAYASAYNTAIATVRKVYSGPIIIDAPGYGQEANTAANAVKGTGGTKINDGNIILSMHIYPNGYNEGANHTVQNADLDELASAGRSCILGEFGNSPSGSANWSGIVTYAKSKGWTVMGWAWNGDGGSMNMVTPSWASNPTATSFTTSSYFSVIYNLL